MAERETEAGEDDAEEDDGEDEELVMDEEDSEVLEFCSSPLSSD